MRRGDPSRARGRGGGGTELARRYGGADGPDVNAEQGGKRVALRFVCARAASWDHRKLSKLG
jgi:hypothetical protein